MATNNSGVLGAAAAAGQPNPVTTTTTANVGNVPIPTAPGSPELQGGLPGEENRDQLGQTNDPTAGIGTDGEEIVWEARYSMRNFIGRGLIVATITGLWLWLASFTWYQNHQHLSLMTSIVGGIVGCFVLGLAYRMIQARYSHYYKLTTRRLFVSSGIFSRRRDMMELLKLKDVYTRQGSLMQRALGLGTVIAESSEHGTPTFFLPGVSEPKQVMDLIWHHARAERDQRSMKVESV